MYKNILLKLSALLLIFPVLSPLTASAQEFEFDQSQIYEFLPISAEDLEYEVNSSNSEAIIATVITIIGGIGLMVALGVSFVSYLYCAWSLMTIARKLKDSTPWMAWVPILNLYLLFRVAGLNPWLFLLIFVPFVNIVVGIYVVMKIAERRGFPSWLGILSVVPFVNIILPGYLAFAEPSK